MIGKIRSIQDSWFMKAILVLTALSFMSLFGISGYLGSAAQDKSVVEVDDIVISQAQISQQLSRELQTARKLFGDDIEINDGIRVALLQNIVNKELANAIIRKTARDNNVLISDALVSKVIASMPEFRDLEGKFSPSQMRLVLSNAGFSENMYINQLKEDIAKQHLVASPVQGMNIPEFMVEYINKIDNQKKVFKYLTINPQNMKIDRKISQDEKEQYYSDFGMQFIEPEKRDVTFVAFSIEDVAGAFTPNAEEIEQYYNDNIAQFTVPEKRTVLQMVFDNEDTANEALKKLDNKRNFYAVADSDAKQTKENTELGDVSIDELLPEVAEAVFALDKNQHTAPIKSEFGWHIMKVTNILPTKQTSLAQATKQITETLRKEQAYDLAEVLVNEIEDMAGKGVSLKDIAAEKKLPIYEVVALMENGESQKAPTNFAKLVKSTDFIDNSFSYNVNEISQVFETDEGFAVLSVNNIIESRRKSIDEVEAQIVKLWETNEKEAIAQEIINDANHDLENGDEIEDVAARFKLPLKTTRALTRSESFAGLSPLQMKDLFKEALNDPKILQTEDGQILAINTKIVNSNVKPSRADIEATRLRSSNELSQNMAQQLVNDYGSNYNVKVDYKSIGLAD